jgi:hypothetical protein
MQIGVRVPHRARPALDRRVQLAAIALDRHVADRQNAALRGYDRLLERARSTQPLLQHAQRRALPAPARCAANERAEAQ